MSNQSSVIYVLGVPDDAPPGQLIHVEEHPDGLATVYFNPLEIRSAAVWDVNWFSRHQMGHGLWQQNWGPESHEGRVQEPSQGMNVAVARWEIAPAHKLPRGAYVCPIEHEGSLIWYFRSGYITQALCDAMNQMFERVAGDALWVQRWYDRDRFNHGGPDLPDIPSSEVSLLV